MCVMRFNWQLNDMERFLTCNHHFGIPAIDIMYKLGKFYVTPTTYPHLILQDVKSNKHLAMIGPLLVHQKFDIVAFNYFTSSLIGLKRDLKQVLAFGRDGHVLMHESQHFYLLLFSFLMMWLIFSPILSLECRFSDKCHGVIVTFLKCL